MRISTTPSCGYTAPTRTTSSAFVLTASTHGHRTHRTLRHAPHPPSCSASSSHSTPTSTSTTPGPAVTTRTPTPPAPIKLIVTDVDGTLLNSDQNLDNDVLESIQNARQAGVPLMIATGKAIGPWTTTILPALDSPCPQIFLQGLYIRDKDGKTLYSNTLHTDVLAQCVALAKRLDVTLVLYGSDRIICETRDRHSDRLLFYGEPTPEAVGDVCAYLEGTQMDIHKVIFMAGDAKITDTVRPVVEMELARYQVALTSAIEGMVEVLPPGASKGKGVGYVLEHILQVDPQSVMALGDGENDVEMLDMVGWGVAVANAGDKAKDAADYVLDVSNDQGAVGKAIRTWVDL